jgi:hypothetical protein
MKYVMDARDFPAAEATRPLPERLLGPVPVQAVRNLHSSADGKLHVGEWTSGTGAWKVEYTETEACFIVEGVVRLRDDAGNERTYCAGEGFLLLPGFRGVWEVLEPCRKLYIIYE